MIQLKRHQIEAVDFLKDHRGLILYHSTGSGKTLTALFAAYQLNYPIVIIGPKSSRKTFSDNIKIAEFDPDRADFYTYTMIKKILEQDIAFLKDKFVVLDEAHAIRNENMYNLYIASALTVSARVVLLTATPVVNHLSDLAVLVNVVRGEDVLPTDRKLFDQMFYDEDRMQLINVDILRSKIRDTISYYMTDDIINYPKSQVHYVEVEMSHDQVDEYAYYIRKIIYEGNDMVSNIDVLNLDYGLLPNKKRNYFLNVTRQLSNTVRNSADSPKILEIFEHIKTGPWPVIVYSNYLKNGIYTLAILLEKNGITYKTITGYITNEKLELIVNNYNQGMYQVLLISSAGSESLDLKKTRQIHIMEPHWNEARIRQVIGRTIRYLSHEALPETERRVDIYRWISVFPKKIKNISADQYLIDVSRRKQDVWDQYQKIIIEMSINSEK